MPMLAKIALIRIVFWQKVTTTDPIYLGLEYLQKEEEGL